MKSCFRRLITILCILVMLLSSTGVYADKKKETKKDEPPYKKYQLQEDFIYEDEFIAHALKSSVVKIVLSYSAELEYEPVIFNTVKLEEDFAILYEEFYLDYTAEEIAAELLSYVSENLTSYLVYSEPKEVSTDGTWVGSGVIISEDGYIATNSHVASLSKEARLELAISTLQEGIYEDLSNALEEMEEYGIVISDEEVQSLYEIILDETSNNAEIIKESSKLRVCLPSSSGGTDIDSSRTFDAEIVAEGTQEGKERLTQDTAILKIEADNLVCMKLSEDYPELGTKIVSAGFPVASDAIFQEIGSDESVLSMTVGKGEIARIVPIDGSDYQAIEISTTISGGNSGGPSVDEGLNIEGLNTYILNTDARYAYMVPAEYVAELAEDFDIEQGETTKIFLLGLQSLQQGYGKTALECFEKVKELREDTPYIENLITLAEKAPSEDAPLLEPSEEEDTIFTAKFIIISASVLALIIVIVLIIILVKRKNKRKKAKAATMPNTSTAPTSISAPVPTPKPIPTPTPSDTPASTPTPKATSDKETSDGSSAFHMPSSMDLD